jgi:hypothetical protein
MPESACYPQLEANEPARRRGIHSRVSFLNMSTCTTACTKIEIRSSP